jgi:tripartite-type tricarboxylate transporter receptor subunit TctC
VTGIELGAKFMSMPKMALSILSILAATLQPANKAPAQTYPSRPITLVVPFAAGGSSDIVARIIADDMRSSLGQPVIVENVVGASGSIGMGRVARAPADGYMLGLGGLATNVLNGVMLTVQYDVLKDFEPVALVTTMPMLIVAKKEMPAQSLKELIVWLKTNSDKALQGTFGVATASHVAGVFFQNEIGARFRLVPYRGGAMQDLIAGRFDMMIDLPPSSLPHIRAGTIKAYAVTAKARMESAPDIPTVDEAGLPHFHVSTWQALFAPKDTSKDIVNRLNAAVVKALADPLVRRRLGDIGQDIPPPDQQSPQALSAHHKAEVEKWWPIIREANIKPE